MESTSLRPLGSYFWEGCRVRLRALTEADARAWVESAFDSETQRLLNPGIDLPRSEAEIPEFTRKFANFSDAAGITMFSIETLAGELVGAININAVDQRHGTFYTGSLIHRQHRGKGYFEEAKRILLRYCFHELRLQKYNSTCVEFNEGMIRHFKRIGCQLEGRRRRAVFTNGRYWDDLLYGLTREEFDDNDAVWKRENGYSS